MRYTNEERAKALCAVGKDFSVIARSRSGGRLMWTDTNGFLHGAARDLAVAAPLHFRSGNQSNMVCYFDRLAPLIAAASYPVLTPPDSRTERKRFPQKFPGKNREGLSCRIVPTLQCAWGPGGLV
jgi:hypothetical protein